MSDYKNPPKFRRLTRKNAPQVLRTLADFVEFHDDPDSNFVEAFDLFLEELSGNDFFGTEGQCDPRGDQR